MELVHFYVHLVIDNGKYVLKSKGYGGDIASIELDVNFSNQSDPSSSTITIHGLTRKTAAKIYNGASVDVYAGYFNMDYTNNNIAYVTGGTVSSLNPLYNSGGDWQLSFTITDGSQYDNIATIKREVSKSVRTKATLKHNPKLTKAKERDLKALTNKYKAIRAKGKLTSSQRKNLSDQEKNAKQSVNTKYTGEIKRATAAANKSASTKKKVEQKPLSFKKGTTGQTIITTLASKAGIKIKKMKLVKNKVFKGGYVANKRPYKCIVEVANDCNTDVFYQHGGLNIAGYANQKKLKYVATTETGIITPPQLQVDDSTDSTQSTTNNSKKKKKKNKSANKLSPDTVNSSMFKNGTYQMSLIFNPQITTGSVFMLKDKMTGFNDWVIANSGEHTYSPGSTPTTQINFELYSKYKADQKTKAAQEAAKKKAKSAKAAKAKAKKTRTNRTKTKLAKGGNAHGTSSAKLLHAATRKSIR